LKQQHERRPIHIRQWLLGPTTFERVAKGLHSVQDWLCTQGEYIFVFFIGRQNPFALFRLLNIGGKACIDFPCLNGTWPLQWIAVCPGDMFYVAWFLGALPSPDFEI
tara:strand:- start:169 stop:489 length:321 start_codon:yes stop_codon:yes gene_type:complete